MPNLMEQHGAQPQKSPRYTPIFIDRLFTGTWTQRSPLHDPSDVVTSKFYGGRPDALWQGSNVELTNRLTLQRRPGLIEFSTATYPTPPNIAYAFELTNGTIQVIVDTGYSPTFNIDQVANLSGTVYYYFTSPVSCAANDAYAGLNFTIAGFDNGANNGTFTCLSSTSTYLLLSNPNAVNDTASATAITSGGVYWDHQNGTLQLLFAKSAGAGQTGFQAVAGTLYMGDGVDTRKYTPGNPNGLVWNYGIAATVNQPTVTIVESGSAAVTWESGIFYSTMGLLLDSNGNIEQLTSVNSSGTNTTQYGVSGDGQPPWNIFTGGQTPDSLGSNLTWTCAGPLQLWKANTTFDPGACIFVPGVGGTPIPSTAPNGIRGLNYPGTTGGGIWCTLPGGKTGTAQPKWNPTTDIGSSETTGWHWNYLGAAILWKPSTRYNSFWEWSNEVVVEPTLPNLALLEAGTQTIYAQTANNATVGSVNNPGTSGTGYTPPWPSSSTDVGQTTGDGDLVWQLLGSGTWDPNFDYIAWTATGALFSAIVDSVGNFQVCIANSGGTSQSVTPLGSWQPSHTYASNFVIGIQSGTSFVSFKVTAGGGGNSGSTEPTWNFTNGSTTSDGALTWTSQGVYTAGPVWGQNYGSQTQDGAVTWTNVGSAKYSTWSTSVTWYLPSSGFAPPSSSQPYGGAEVIGNSDVQAVIQSGLSGGSVPSWGTIGSNTVDNDAIWYTIAAATSNSLAWTAGYSYAYSYKARENNDYYSPTSVGGGGNLPPGVANALSAPTGSESGGISTASPAFNIVGSNAGAVNTVSGIGSTDPQVDTIVIWRSPDSAAGSSNMLELTEIPNPPPVNGQAQPWTFKDYLPDNPTSVYPGLDVLSPAPIGDVNDPPPSNYIPMVYNFQRIWGSSGQLVQWSGGPDTLVGNPNECYNPDDDFPYLANVLRLIKNSQGIVVFTTDSTEFLGGGPQTSSFYTVTLAPGIGLGNFNGADSYAGEIFFVSADSQFKSINPSLQLSNLGFPIGDQIADLDSSKVYVAVNQVGVDNAIYIADGSTGWWRCNPHQVPQNEPIWSPFASITNGCKMVQSVEISPGQKRLLVGGTSCNQQILERNLNTFSDNGVAYSECYFVMGSITLCHPGQVAILRALEIDGNMTPKVGVLIDEIAGSFTTLSQPVYDPPALYGTTLSPTSYFPNRWYFAQKSNTPNRCRHLQIRVDMPSGSTSGDEIYTMTIIGRLMVEL